MNRRGRIGLIAATLAVAALAHGAQAPAQAQTTTYPEAVVLVSGFTTTTPFTNPDPACNGQEGLTWSPPTGVAAALKAAGNAVFTAPIRHLDDPVALPCPGSGAPAPPISNYIDSGGDDDANGAALAGFLAFLRDSYGVQRVHLVAHSDGGNWSRSAITQDSAYAGVAIRSLTTLGTPYTGAFSADLAIETQGGKCDFSEKIEQAICDALIDVIDVVFKDMGPIATNQLTHEYLEIWNSRQQIGACPVTTIGGTYFKLPLPLSYYSPSDALVGQASALAKSALDISLQTIPAPAIPNLQFGGLYDVVHSETLSFLTPKNLLNQSDISAKVASVVAGTPTGPPCNDPGAAAPQAPLSAQLPLRMLVAPSANGSLGPTKPEDAVIAGTGATVRCGRRPLQLTAVGDDARVRFGLGRGCKRKLRVSGGGRRALLLRSHPRNRALVKVDGQNVRVRVLGPKTGKVRVTASAGGKGRTLRLDSKGRGTLGAQGADTTLRIATTTQPGARRAVATVVVPG